MSESAVTPMAFIRAIVLAYEKDGADPTAALRRARITPSEVRRKGARVTAAQLESMSSSAMQELDDEALGWFSRKLPWGTYGMLCRASLTAPTLGVALARWCRHHRLVTDDVILTLHVASTEARIEVEERGVFGEMRELCLVTLLRYVHGYACWLIDSRIPLLEATFPYDAPAHHDAYPAMFPSQGVTFGAKRAGFRFDARYLDMPAGRDDGAMRSMLERALSFTVWPYRKDRLLEERVRTLLQTRPTELRNATALAKALHVSVRTLHRQLAEHGSTLQALKDESRRDRAVDLLRRTRKPIKQIANEVGFESEKSFARAFRIWTGKSPRETRSDNEGQFNVGT